MGEASWTDGWWQSADGLRLHYRDYPGDPAKVPVLCIPGLTRNARDFDRVAARLQSSRRVIVVELRGRGLSQYSPDPEDYNPKTYLLDLIALLDRLALPKVVLFGTSLGGIVTMLFGVTGDPRLAGFLLNDIGPIVSETGLERIRTYVGAATRWADWDEAAAAMAIVHSDAYPEYQAAEWQRMARQLAREEDGVIVSDYDPAIAMLTQQPTPKLAEPWGFFERLKGKPGLLVYGALSNILEASVASEMVVRLPELELVTLPRVGHPPTLEEPEAVAGIDRLLARIDARAL